jgi:hypothetical protein
LNLSTVLLNHLSHLFTPHKHRTQVFIGWVGVLKRKTIKCGIETAYYNISPSLSVILCCR